MVFDYYGEYVPQLEIAEVARTQGLHGVTFTDELRRAAHFSNMSTSCGTEMVTNITRYSARTVGYAGFEQWGLTIDSLKALIDGGEPVIVLMWMTEPGSVGHFRVVIGYNETHMVTHDPWYGANMYYNYSTFLNLWQYSGFWGLLVSPWRIELQMPNSVNIGGTIEVVANITYPCSNPFDNTTYPASFCNATIELQPSLELNSGETAQHPLGNVAAGTSVQTRWLIHATEAGKPSVSVSVAGAIQGSVETHGPKYPSYEYEDRIGGSSARSLSVVNPYPVHNLNTGYNYTTIQDAVNANETLDGHTIFAEAGVYYEHITALKSIVLLGENKDNTVIDGNGTGTIVNILADNITIANFTLRNGGHGVSWLDSCIYGNYHSNIMIENNTVMNATNGIIFHGFSNSTIRQNLADRFGLMGLHLDGNSTNCTISDNTVTNSLEGIELEQSAGNRVERNQLKGNNASIVFTNCNGKNLLSGNNMSSDSYNLVVWGSDLGAFVQNIDTSNTANHKKIYYITNSQGLLVNPSTCPDLGYLAVVNCSSIMIEDLDLSFNRDGLLMAQSANCSLSNVTISGNQGSLLNGGLTMFASRNNLIANSRISNNSVGVCFCQSSENLFYHNSFVNDSKPVISNFQSPFSSPSGSNSINNWNSSLEGNYWSDYNGTDLYRGPHQNDNGSDGIGDTAYIIDGNNTDSYPLMGTFSEFNATSEQHVQIVCNSTISDFQFNGTAIIFNVAGKNGTVGFCRICIPTALMNGTYGVFVNGTEVTYTLLPCSNSAHSYLYFNHTHSTHEVAIVPEFPPFLILPLSMAATLLWVIFYRRKHARQPCTSARINCG